MNKVILCFTLYFLPFHSNSQSAFLNRHADNYYILNYYEVLRGEHSDTLHTAVNPISQKDAISYLQNYLEQREDDLSASQQWEINNILSKNGEWVKEGNAAIDSKLPIFNTFYKKQSDMIHVEGDDFELIVNPIIYYQQSIESGNTDQHLFINSKGIEARGNIGKRLGFYTSFTDNQERGPLHHQQYILNKQAVPGATFYKDFKIDKPGIAQDYLVASGYIDADIIRNKVNLSFGHNRFQLGDGYRSLFLDDVGANYLFLKLNTRLGKFNYQNLFLELTPQEPRGADRLLPRKYAAIHHLSVNIGKWLNLGLYESIVYSRKDHFDFQYLNPIILYRSVEQSNGSPDNAMLGMNFKINTRIKTVVYGQVLLDEFSFSKVKEGNGWWGNKYGLQLGLKMADLFGIRNLYIQPEFNLIRPFTYTFRDSVAEFSHYNQSLAHPYGANLMELSLLMNYKLAKRLYVTWKTFYNKQGRDTVSNVSFGGNIFSSYTNRNSETGIFLFNGYASEVLYSNLNIAYEFRDNLFLDLGIRTRSEIGSHAVNPTYNSNMLYIGFRLNAVRREYDY